MVYKPVYKPLSSQSLSFSLFSSDLTEKLVEYFEGDGAELKEKLERAISFSVTSYKIVFGNKILGNPNLISNETYSSYLLTNDNKKLKIEVLT